MMMMMLKSGGGTAMAVPCRPSGRPMCLASNVNTEQLRAQLGQLHSEAESARNKANNARLRLLRLSETAENLRRQAAINVRTGREDDARDLLFQKKKVMEALEKSKKRIELFDELSTKLNEVISLKERQLIGNVALDLEVVREDASSPVRIVSPAPEAAEDLDEGTEFVPNDLKPSDKEERALLAKDQASLPVEPEEEDIQEPLKRGAWNSDPVRIVSPTPEVAEDLDEGTEFVPYDLKLSDKEERALIAKDQANLPVEPEGEDIQEPLKRGAWNEDKTISSLKGITSFENFLEHLDHQLNTIEAELVTILRISTLVVDSQEKSKNFKVQQTMELLESVSGIRQRISSMKMANVEQMKLQ